MSKPINENKAKIWNERFNKRMKELNLSQRKFIRLYKERFGTGSQSDVSKWMHIGEKDGRTNKNSGRKFPEFETMRNIAEILEVNVGYLIGETDFSTFQLEDASKYMNISPAAIESIRAITYGKVIPPFYKYPDPQISAALELILTYPHLVEYLKNLCDIAEALHRKKTPINLPEKAVEKIPKSYRDSAISLCCDSEEAIANGIEPTEELLAFAYFLDDAFLNNMHQSNMADSEIKSAKYALQEAHIKMVDQLTSPDNLKRLLPHYATREEINQMTVKSAKKNN